MNSSPKKGNAEDVEAQTRLLGSDSSNLAASEEMSLEMRKEKVASIEEKAPCTTQLFWIAIWMVNNILVTIMNKAAFAKVDFNYPYALSTIHMACNVVGSQLYFLLSRSQKPKLVEPSNRRSIFIFSVIFSLNIAIGNTSLSHVSVNFNQVCRALVPGVVMAIGILYYGDSYTYKRKLAVAPIVLGVALSFYGDMSFTAVGAAYTAFCVLLAALKSVAANKLLTGDLKLQEMDLLYKMCPFALLQIGSLALLSGEVTEIIERWDVIAATPAPQVVLLSGFLSFTLNVSSLIANKVSSALTLSISANVKQVGLVVFSTMFFGDTVTFLNGLGITIVLCGSAVYGYVSENGF